MGCLLCFFRSSGQLAEEESLLSDQRVERYNSDHMAQKKMTSKSTEFKSFIFAFHPSYGFLLLKAYKRKKGLHYQVPGGRVDQHELEDQLCFQVAAARELFEETGIDVRSNLGRLQELDVKQTKRKYFYMELENKDSVPLFEEDVLMVSIEGEYKNKRTFNLKFSHEHKGAIFEEPSKVAERIQHHSGGKNSVAFKEFWQKYSHWCVVDK